MLALAWSADFVCGALLLVLFALGLPAPAWVYGVFAAALGLGLAGTEMAGMRLAVGCSHPQVLRRRVAWFSFTKALGVGTGFLVGGAVAGGARAAGPARVLVGLAALAILGLAGFLLRHPCLAPRDFVQATQTPGPEDPPPGRPATALTGMACIALNFVVINLANAVVPFLLLRQGALSREWVGVLLAAEAYAHALGTLVFRRGLGAAGNLGSYALGMGASLALLAFLAFHPGCGAGALLGLLLGLGLTTGLSYMMSTLLFFASGFPRALFPRVATQKLASGSGRALGSWLASAVMSSLDQRVSLR
jgi:hypothetical protein